MEKFAGLKFSQIKNSKIIDSNDEEVGRLLDAVFKPSENGLVLTKFTVGGTRWEEILEDIGLKDDVDPVFSTELIEKASPRFIQLSLPKSELKSTKIDEDAIEKDEIKLSELSKYKLFDTNNENLGNIMDLKFESNKFQFILGDGFALELLEDMNLRPDIDLLLSPEFISSIGSDKIILKQEKSELEQIFEKHLPKFKRADIDTEEDVGMDKRKSYYFPRRHF